MRKAIVRQGFGNYLVIVGRTWDYEGPNKGDLVKLDIMEVTKTKEEAEKTALFFNRLQEKIGKVLTTIEKEVKEYAKQS